MIIRSDITYTTCNPARYDVNPPANNAMHKANNDLRNLLLENKCEDVDNRLAHEQTNQGQRIRLPIEKAKHRLITQPKEVELKIKTATFQQQSNTIIKFLRGNRDSLQNLRLHASFFEKQDLEKYKNFFSEIARLAALKRLDLTQLTCADQSIANAIVDTIATQFPLMRQLENFSINVVNASVNNESINALFDALRMGTNLKNVSIALLPSKDITGDDRRAFLLATRKFVANSKLQTLSINVMERFPIWQNGLNTLVSSLKKHADIQHLSLTYCNSERLKNDLKHLLENDNIAHLTMSIAGRCKLDDLKALQSDTAIANKLDKVNIVLNSRSLYEQELTQLNECAELKNSIKIMK